jgi:hypothetical protein
MNRRLTQIVLLGRFAARDLQKSASICVNMRLDQFVEANHARDPDSLGPP